MKYFIFISSVFLNFLVSPAIFAINKNISPEHVSMISLIANPDKYDNKLVKVEGFSIVGTNDSPILYKDSYYLYFNKESSNNYLGKNAICLLGFPRKIRKRDSKCPYTATGIFSKREKSQRWLGGCDGFLKKLQKFEIWAKSEYCKRVKTRKIKK